MHDVSLPQARGPLGGLVLDLFATAPGGELPRDLGADFVSAVADPLVDEDLQLALYLCYELHYRGLPGVEDAWEWDPGLLALRGRMEAAFEAAVRAAVGPVEQPDPAHVDDALRDVIAADDAPSVSSYVARAATIDQVRELLIHRSAYQLKEADPHSFALPRLTGGPKSAMVEIQMDEYGGGKPDRIHADLFATTMRALDLDARYGALIDLIPGPTLATVNLASLFGLHRRLRGACAGHLALTEMTSSVPSRKYAVGLRRLGCDAREATEFFDEHVEADAVHESIAAVDLAGGLAKQDPVLGQDAVFGARALALLETRFATDVLTAWKNDRSSLLRPVQTTVSRA